MLISKKKKKGSHRSVIAKVLGCGFEVCEFELLSYHYIQFRTNTFGKGMNSLTPPAMRILSVFFYKDGFDIK